MPLQVVRAPRLAPLGQIARRCEGAEPIGRQPAPQEPRIRGLPDPHRDIDALLDDVDAIGGPTTARFLRTLKRGGALFPIFGLGASDGDEAELRGVTVSTTQVRSNGAQLEEVGRLLDDATIRVAIDSVFPLADAPRRTSTPLRATSGAKSC